MTDEILNFVSAAHATDMISETSVSDADRDEIIRLMISYGPAVRTSQREEN